MEKLEKRSLEVTIDVAKNWVLSDNSTLRNMALNYYTLEELGLGMNNALREIIYDILHKDNYTLSFRIREKLNRFFGGESIPTPIEVLKILAIYFNNGWVKGLNGKGYYIALNGLNFPLDEVSSYRICLNITVVGIGIIYFKSEEYAKMALLILKDIGILGNLFDEL